MPGQQYLFERNSTAFALLFGDERFLSRESTQESDTIKAGETGLPLKEDTTTTGGVENIVEIASASSGKVPGDTKGDPLQRTQPLQKALQSFRNCLIFLNFL